MSQGWFTYFWKTYSYERFWSNFRNPWRHSPLFLIYLWPWPSLWNPNIIRGKTKNLLVLTELPWLFLSFFNFMASRLFFEIFYRSLVKIYISYVCLIISMFRNVYMWFNMICLISIRMHRHNSADGFMNSKPVVPACIKPCTSHAPLLGSAHLL